MHIIFCAHISEGEGLVVPGTERHARLYICVIDLAVHDIMLSVSGGSDL